MQPSIFKHFRILVDCLPYLQYSAFGKINPVPNEQLNEEVSQS